MFGFLLYVLAVCVFIAALGVWRSLDSLTLAAGAVGTAITVAVVLLQGVIP